MFDVTLRVDLVSTHTLFGTYNVLPSATGCDQGSGSIGHAMNAYFGGRAECRIRRVPVPVVYMDFQSMYPTVCALMNLGKLLTC